MRIPFRIVDVFTDRPLAGNQLCVVPDPADIPGDLMQAVAAEIGFSETTFVTSIGRGRYAVRIFTPGQELPFAGHPTLGTAFALVSEGRVANPVTQVSAAGEVPVTVDLAGGSARMRQLPPEFGPWVEAREEVAAAVGLEPGDLRGDLVPQVVSTGVGHLMVGATDPLAVGRASVDLERLTVVLHAAGADGLYLFAVEGDRAKARALFPPATGLVEDPATGSAAGPLGAYLAEYEVLSSGRLTILQGAEIGRPSTLLVDVTREGDTWRIDVAGGVVRVAEGTFDLPG
jgi:trans-2,3-dihydro-3-hydroxyanthranilate isomerase